LGLSNQRLIRSFLSLAGAGGELRRLMDESTTAWEKNTAATREANIRYNTSAKRWQLLKNHLIGVGIAIGDSLRPSMETLLSSFLANIGVLDGLIPMYSRLNDWLVARIPSAINGLIGFITGRFIPGLQAIRQFIISQVIPAFQLISTFVQTYVVPVLLKLATFVQTTVIPALIQIGAFIQSTVIPALVSFGTYFQTTILPMLSRFSAFIQSTVIPALVSFGSAVQEQFIAIVTAIVPLLLGLKDSLSELFLTVFPQFSGGVGSVADTISQKLTTAFITIQPSLQAIQIAFNSLTTVVLPALIEVASAVVQHFTESWPQIQAVTITVWEVISSVVLSVVQVFETQVLPPLKRAFDQLTLALNALGLNWSDVWNGVATAVKIVGVIIGAIVLALIATITGIATAVANIIEHASADLHRLAQLFADASDAVTSIIVNLVQAVRAIFEGDLSGALGYLGQAFSSTGDLVGTILEAMLTTIDLTFGSILSGVAGFIEGFTAFFIDLYANLTGSTGVFPKTLNTILDLVQNFDWISMARNAIDAVILGFTNSISAVINTIQTIVNNISTTFKTAVNWFKLGAGIVQGIIDGIKSLAGKVADEVKSMVLNAFQKAKDAIHMHSPSLLFKRVGVSIGQGIAAGIRSQKDNVAQSLTDVLNWSWTSAVTIDNLPFLHSGTIHLGIFRAAQQASGVLGSLGGQLQDSILDPLKQVPKLTEDLNTAIGNFIPALMQSNFFFDLANYSTPGQLLNNSATGLNNIIGALQRLAAVDPSTRERVQTLLDMANAARDYYQQLQNVTDATREYTGTTDSILSVTDALNAQRQAEEQLAHVEEQRAQFNFLQQQLEFIRLVADSGLNVGEVFSGIQLGINANLGDLITVVSDTMQQLISAANDELQIHSPSKVFMHIGQQIMSGLMLGIQKAENTLSLLATPASQVASLPVSTTQTNTLNMTVQNNLDAAVLQQLIRQTFSEMLVQ